MPKPAVRSPARVLVVDDDARTARLLARMLGEDGYDVELALDGAAAVGRLARLPTPDILVTDMKMPHVDGAGVARYARWRRPGLPVFLVTGHPELVSDLARTFDPPALVFTKPLDYTALVDALARATDGAPAANATR